MYKKKVVWGEWRMKIINKIKTHLRGEADLEHLIKSGLVVGKAFSYGRYCFFDPSFCFLISIGDNVTFSTRVHVLAHDASLKRTLGYSKVGKVNIGNNVFIGANTTILPGISIGDFAIVGAGSVVTKSIPAHEVWGGDPAKMICTLEEYKKKINDLYTKKYGAQYKIGSGITPKMKAEMLTALEDTRFILVE